MIAASLPLLSDYLDAIYRMCFPMWQLSVPGCPG